MAGRRELQHRASAATLVIAALLLSALLLAAGCGPHAPTHGSRLVLALPDSVRLDPRASQDDWATPLLALLHEGLVRFDTTGAIQAAGARDWKVSASGLTYTFHLRSDWRFEDGSRVTAGDCARTLDSLFHVDPPSPARPRFWSLAGALATRAKNRGPLGLETRDSTTLVVHLSSPDPVLLDKLAQPRYAVPTASPERERQAGHALATGPYRLAGPPGERAILVRNPFYRGTAPAIPDTIVVLFGVSTRRAVLGLASGRVDVVWPAPLGILRERLAREDKLVPVEGTARDAPVWVLALHSEVFPMARHSARYALARGLNRERAVEAVAPYGFPWRTFAPVGAGPAMAPGFDPQAAHQALALDKHMSGFQIAIQAPAASPEAAASRALLGDFGRASIYGEIRPRPRAAFWHDLYAPRASVATFLVWRAPTNDPIEGLAEWLLNRSLDERWAGNLGGLRSPGLDSLLLRALRERSVEGRQALRTEIEIRLADEVPYLPVARVRELAYVRTSVTGLAFHRYYGLDLGRARVGR
jgi:ABC-type transport system substrate-binding protein